MRRTPYNSQLTIKPEYRDSFKRYRDFKKGARKREFGNLLFCHMFTGCCDIEFIQPLSAKCTRGDPRNGEMYFKKGFSIFWIDPDHFTSIVKRHPEFVLYIDRHSIRASLFTFHYTDHLLVLNTTCFVVVIKLKDCLRRRIDKVKFRSLTVPRHTVGYRQTFQHDLGLQIGTKTIEVARPLFKIIGESPCRNSALRITLAVVKPKVICFLFWV